MSSELNSKATDLLRRPVIADVATVDPDGTPQITPVWIDVDETGVLFNTARGRRKTRNLETIPHLAISVVDPLDPYNVVIIKGEAEFVENGADDHIDRLAKKYLDKDTYPWRSPDEKRVIVRIGNMRVVRQPVI